MDSAIVGRLLHSARKIACEQKFNEISKDISKQVGDAVFSKVDSSRAIVTDIVIGGSSYEYYVKYEITANDGTTTQIDPSLVW